MNAIPRIGQPQAEIVVFNKGGRDFRIKRLEEGQEVPHEFFYGFFELAKAGLSASMLSSAGAEPGALGAAADRVERAFAYVTGAGMRPFSARLQRPLIDGAKVVMSYTDGHSLSLGLGLAKRPDRPILMGGFHGLSDIESRAAPAIRPLVRTLIRRALDGLDHAFFFGGVDREAAIDRYGLSPERSSVIPFGIDTGFWRPLPDQGSADYVIAVGQDHNRDYDLLARAPTRRPICIVTRTKVRIPEGADHVVVTSGDYFGSDSMTDEDLRRLYNQARAVVVPLKDVNQPTGYSVTLQSMSCGRPVILSKIRGLWAPQLLLDGENCLLVPPGDAAALGAAIERVQSDGALAARLGRAARETAMAHFGLDQIGGGTLALARLGLKLWEERLSGGSALVGP